MFTAIPGVCSGGTQIQGFMYAGQTFYQLELDPQTKTLKNVDLKFRMKPLQREGVQVCGIVLKWPSVFKGLGSVPNTACPSCCPTET